MAVSARLRDASVLFANPTTARGADRGWQGWARGKWVIVGLGVSHRLIGPLIGADLPVNLFQWPEHPSHAMCPGFVVCFETRFRDATSLGGFSVNDDLHKPWRHQSRVGADVGN